MLGVVGDLVEDIVVWPTGPISHGTDTTSEVFRVRGGSAANVAAMAGSAYPTRFFGCVGDDAAGTWIADTLEASGVDVRLQRRGRTGTIVLLVDETGERTMFPDRGASLLMEALDSEELDDVELLHMPSYCFQGTAIRAQMELTASRAVERGVPLSIDASSTALISELGRSDYLALLHRLAPDFLFANQAEAALLGLDSGSPLLPALPKTTFVVKNGPRPTVVLRYGRKTVCVPTEHVDDVRDSTGAGDAFAAGFLVGHLTHGEIDIACRSAHAFAARVLRTPGAHPSYR